MREMEEERLRMREHVMKNVRGGTRAVGGGEIGRWKEVLLGCLPLPGSPGGHQPGPPRDPGGVPRIHAEEGVRGHRGGLGGEDKGDTLGLDYPSLTDLTLPSGSLATSLSLWVSHPQLPVPPSPWNFSRPIPDLPPTLAFIPFPSSSLSIHTPDPGVPTFPESPPSAGPQLVSPCRWPLFSPCRR